MWGMQEVSSCRVSANFVYIVPISVEWCQRFPSMNLTKKKNKITFTHNINGLFLFSRCFKSQNDRVAVCLVRHTWNTHIHMLQLECLYGICSIYPIYYTLCFHILIIALKWKRIKREKTHSTNFDWLNKLRDQFTLGDGKFPLRIIIGEKFIMKSFCAHFIPFHFFLHKTIACYSANTVMYRCQRFSTVAVVAECACILMPIECTHFCM